jgi:hypothetical protein
MEFSNLIKSRNGWKCLVYVAFAGVCCAQSDPGPRGGAAGAGGPFSGLGAQEKAVFTAAQGVFEEVDSVSGTVPGENGVGLGPTFNANSCAACHAQPAVGGTSPAVNPQVALAKLDHPNPDPFPQTVPSFIKANGPVREARFVLRVRWMAESMACIQLPDARMPPVVPWRSRTSPHNSLTEM